MQEPRANQGENRERTKKEETKREATANQEEDQRKARGQPKQAKDTTSGDHRAQVPPPMIDDKQSQTSKQTRDPRGTYFGNLMSFW